MADPELDEVEAFFRKIPDLERQMALAIRQAFDEVIDGERTGRYRIEQLEKTEKTYIGTKVEIILRNELKLPRGKVLDNLILGHEVDTKFSLSGAWMIPKEAINQICLVVQGDDKSGLFSAGLVRASPRVLTTKGNQDKKLSISAAGKKEIRWLRKDGFMVPNFLLKLDERSRNAILGEKYGKRRIIALFRNATGRIIPRTAILQVARLDDPLKRAREAKKILRAEGITLLCAKYLPERQQMIARGFNNLDKSDWVSIAP